MYSKINNINFTANLDTTFLKKDSKRWENIAKIYEEITPEYPNDTFYLESFENKYNMFNATNVNKQDGSCSNFQLCKHGYKDLMEYSDNEIARKFRNIIRIAHQNKINHEKAIQFIKSVGLSDENSKKLLKIMDNHKIDTQAELTQNDSFLKYIDLNM